jgi:glycosyltransferase involved in cell wall biosynthesis
MSGEPRLAVAIPCYNEALTIAQVIEDFRHALPNARILIFDNNSTDGTAQRASACLAEVVHSPTQGKGNVVRHMFDVIEADVYVMVDGDSTYPANAAPKMIRCLFGADADMVVGARMANYATGSFRRLHALGNKVLARLISSLFHIKVTDVLSGYRVFSRDFVKTVPVMAEGFEIETELTLQAAAKRFKIVEYPIEYRPRPEGSVSKLNTFSDGVLILRALFTIFKSHRPQLFFSSFAAVLGLLSLLAGFAPIVDYYQTRYVTHVPLAILAAAIGILSVLSLSIGLILDTVNRYHNETFVLWRRQLSRREEKDEASGR